MSTPAKPKLVGIHLNYEAGGKSLWVTLDPKDIKGVVTDKQEIQAIISGGGNMGGSGKPPGASDPTTNPPITGPAIPGIPGAEQPPECCYFVNGEWICW